MVEESVAHGTNLGVLRQLLYVIPHKDPSLRLHARKLST